MSQPALAEPAHAYCRLANEAVTDLFVHGVDCPVGAGVIGMLGEQCVLSPDDAAARAGVSIADTARLTPPDRRPGNTEVPGPVRLDPAQQTKAVLRGKPRGSKEPWTTWEFYGPEDLVASNPAEARSLVAWFEGHCPGYKFKIVQTALHVVEVRRLA